MADGRECWEMRSSGWNIINSHYIVSVLLAHCSYGYLRKIKPIIILQQAILIGLVGSKT